MPNSINVSSDTINTTVNVSSTSTVGNVDASSNYGSDSIETINNAAYHYAELAKQYAEEASQNVYDAIKNINCENNITMSYVGNNITLSTKSFIYNQNIASANWNIQHNLNKRCPQVTVIDSDGNILYPPVDFINENNCVVRLIGAMVGTAYLE